MTGVTGAGVNLRPRTAVLRGHVSTAYARTGAGAGPQKTGGYTSVRLSLSPFSRSHILPFSTFFSIFWLSLPLCFFLPPTPSLPLSPLSLSLTLPVYSHLFFSPLSIPLSCPPKRQGGNPVYDMYNPETVEEYVSITANRTPASLFPLCWSRGESGPARTGPLPYGSTQGRFGFGPDWGAFTQIFAPEANCDALTQI